MKTLSLRSFWGGPGCNFGSFWEPRRGLGGGLGRSWVPLGRLLGPSWWHGSTFVVLSSTSPVSHTQLAPKREPTWHPKRGRKRIKIEVKNEDEKRSSSRRFWSGLKAILGRLGSNLGVKKVVFSLRLKGFRENHVFEQDKASRSDLGRT